MRAPSGFQPWWAACTVWAVANMVNRLLRYAMFALAVPTAAALAAFLRAGSGLPHIADPIAYLAFLALMAVVDYLRPEILVPYLVLFFGAILLMGLPMFRLNRRLGAVTAATTFLLPVTMGAAMRHGAA